MKYQWETHEWTTRRRSNLCQSAAWTAARLLRGQHHTHHRLRVYRMHWCVKRTSVTCLHYSWWALQRSQLALVAYYKCTTLAAATMIGLYHIMNYFYRYLLRHLASTPNIYLPGMENLNSRGLILMMHSLLIMSSVNKYCCYLWRQIFSRISGTLTYVYFRFLIFYLFIALSFYYISYCVYIGIMFNK